MSRPVLLMLVAFAWLSMPAAATAHGPCNCSFPQLGEPGVTVRARTPAYRIVFNPRPGDYVREMRDTGYASAYQPEAPTRTVLSRDVNAPVRPATFRVPEVPPGVYLVLIYDGSEGGSHSTWDYFHVIGSPPMVREVSAAAGATPDSDGGSPLFVALGFAGGALAGAAAVGLLRRSHRTKRSR